MPLLNPIQATPVAIYSNKAVFVTERGSEGEALGDTYTLKIRVAGEVDWVQYSFGPNAVYVYIEDLTPYTEYETRWVITLDAAENESSTYSFFTRTVDRFELRPAIPAPLLGSDYTNALQGELDAHISYINTLDDERAIERFIKEGVGRLMDSNSLNACKLHLAEDSVTVSMYNGWFQCGPGLPATDEHWFPGARLVQLASESGFRTLVTSGDPLLSSGDGTYYGYMGCYLDSSGNPVIDIIWDSEIISPREHGRWLIGSVTLSGGLVASVDSTVADIVPTLLYLQSRIASLTVSTGGGGGGGGEVGIIPANATELKFSAGIDTENTFDAVNAVRTDMTNLINNKIAELQPKQETSLEFLVTQFARSLPGWGVNNAPGLLRIAAAVVIPEVYGQDGIDLELSDEVVPSPDFEGPGTLNYNSATKLWEV